MKQSVLVGPKTSRIEEAPELAVGPKDVLVRVKLCGVCASELHGWKGDSGPYPRRYGHEVSGEVVAVGQDVASVRVGMRVTGLFHQGFAEYALTTEDRVAPIPEGMSYEEALGEPISCVISGVRRTRVDMGDTVAVIGLGFMGLITLQALRLKGPARLIAVDVREEALENALRLGADEAYLPDQVPDRLIMASWDRVGGGYGVDVAVEASGTQPGLDLASRMVREHGFLSIVGYHQGGPRQVDMEMWNWKAFDALNAHERRPDAQMDSMRRGLELVARGRIDVASLVTHRFGLEEVDAAFDTLARKPEGFVKSVVLVP